MGIRFRDIGFREAERELSDAGLEVMRESANTCRDVAKDEAPVDLGALKAGLETISTDDGATVISPMFYSNWVEFGTGRFREGGGGRQTPWTYHTDRFGFVYTHGNQPQPYLRPGFDAGITRFYEEKRRRGL